VRVLRRGAWFWAWRFRVWGCIVRGCRQFDGLRGGILYLAMFVPKKKKKNTKKT
jgi:hypothetical protein